MSNRCETQSHSSSGRPKEVPAERRYFITHATKGKRKEKRKKEKKETRVVQKTRAPHIARVAPPEFGAVPIVQMILDGERGDTCDRREAVLAVGLPCTAVVRGSVRVTDCHV
jgi:hypothetical protein